MAGNLNISDLTVAALDATTFSGADEVSSQAIVTSSIGDDWIRVDPSRSYELSGWAKAGDESGARYNPANIQYFGFASYDVDMKPIAPLNVAKVHDAQDTFLAAALKPGDKYLTLQDASGWYAGSTDHMRSLAWYGYRDSTGYVYPDFTYTRNVLPNAWGVAGISGNRVTLRSAWTGPALPAGTAVRNATSGPTFNYVGLWGSSVDAQWRKYAGTIDGIDDSGYLNEHKFRPGTTYVKPVILFNYGGQLNNQVTWRDVTWSYPESQPFHAGDRVELHVRSSPVLPKPVSFVWTQASGGSIPLQNATSATATFVVPEDFSDATVNSVVRFQVAAGGGGSSFVGQLEVKYATHDLWTTVALDATTFAGADEISRQQPGTWSIGDDLVRVDTDRAYQLSGWAKSGDAQGNLYSPVNSQYFGFASYDLDRKPIYPVNVAKTASAKDTYLAATLKPGDTYLTLQDASEWYAGGTDHMRTLAWYGYRDSSGHVYPDFTYTRNVVMNAWDAGAIVGNRINLRSPWTGPTLPAGMAMRNAMSGPTYNYSALRGGSVSNMWTQYVGMIAGIDASGQLDPNKFRPGTVYVKPILLFNYGGETNFVTWRDVTWTYPQSQPFRAGDTVDLHIQNIRSPDQPVSYLWTQTTGPAVQIQQANQRTATIKIPADVPAGSLKFRIAATGLSSQLQTEVQLTTGSVTGVSLSQAISDIANHLASRNLSLDTTPPAPPSAPKLNAGPTLIGTVEPGSTVRLYVEGQAVASVIADAQGAYTASFPSLGTDNRTITASATDVAGNTSAFSPSLVLLNVKNFGAKGDSATDDTIAIQAALDAAKLVGGTTVFMPSGVYIISNPLIVPSNTQFIGNGQGNSILRGKGVSYGGKIVNGAEVYAAVAMVAVSNSSVESLTVDHRTNGTHANGIVMVPDGVNYSGTVTTNSTIQNAEVLGIDKHNYLIWNMKAENTIIRNNHVDGGVTSYNPMSYQEGIELFGGVNVLIENNLVENIGNFGIVASSLAGFEARDVRILNNTVRNSAHGIGIGANSYPVFPDVDPEYRPVRMSNFVVEGNVVRDGWQNGLVLGFPGPYITASGIDLRGNSITDVPVGILLTTPPAYAPLNMLSNIRVIDNIVDGTTAYAAISLLNMQSVSLTGNTIRDASGEGLRMAGSREITISNNTIGPVQRNAILSDRSVHTTISDNNFTNYAEGLATPGVLLTNDRDSIITRNRFSIRPEKEVYAVVIDSNSVHVQVYDNELLYTPRFAQPFANQSQ